MSETDDEFSDRRRQARYWFGVSSGDRREALAEQKKARENDESRRRKSLAIGDEISRLTKHAFGKRGLAAADLIESWPLIVGSLLASTTFPERINFPRGERNGGTMVLRCAPGGYALQVQHLAPLIIERVNSYFGYGAVAHVRVTQGDVPRRSMKKPVVQKKLSPEEAESIQKTVNTVDDEALRAVLERLGRAIAQRR